MKKRFLIIILTILLALGVVTVALAAAQITLSGAQTVEPAAQSSVPGAQTSAPIAARNNPAGTAPQSAQPPAGQNHGAGEEQAAPRSNSAMIPGFLQDKDTRPSFLPQAKSAKVDAQGIVSLPGRQGQVGMGANSTQALLPGFTVDLAYNVVEGVVNPGGMMGVAAGTAYGMDTADSRGFFWTPLWQDGAPFDLAGGEFIVILTGTINADHFSLVAPTGGLDVQDNQVYGNLPSLGGGVPVTVTIGVWGSPPAEGAPSESTITDPMGNFIVTFTDIDLTAGNFAQVDYRATSLSRVRSYLRPDPSVFVIDNFSSVAGYGQPGQDVQVTVYSDYPSVPRWQGGGATDGMLGFYQIPITDTQVGEVVEVIVNGSPAMTTTVANLHDITFDAATDQVSGTAPEGEEVLVYSYGWSGEAQTYMETTVNAQPGDTFNAALPADLHASDPVAVYVADDNGNSTAIFGGAPFVEAMINPYSDSDCVVGRVEAPNQPITLSIQTATGVYTRTRPTRLSNPGNDATPGFCYLIWGNDWGPINFAPGDVITLQSPNWSGSLTVVDIGWQPDTLGDQITGSAPDGDVRVDVSRWYGEQYPANGGAVRMTSAAAGSFATDFSSFDLRDGDNVFIRHFDPASGFTTQIAGTDFKGLQVHFFTVYAPWGVWIYTGNQGESVTASLYNEFGTWLASSSSTNQDQGSWLGDFQGNPFAPGYWITVTSDSGWSAGFQIPDLTMQADEDTDLIWGEGPRDRLLLETGWGFNGFLPSFGPNGYELDTTAFGHDLVWGDSSNIYSFSPSGDRFSQSKRWPYLVANYGPYTQGNHVWGNGADILANVPVTVTDAGGAVIDTATPQSNSTGDFDTSDLDQGTIAAGNIVYADFGSGDVEGVEVLPVTGEANPDTEMVTITAPVGTQFTMNADGPHGWWDSNWNNSPFVIGPSGYTTINLGLEGYDIVMGTHFNVHTLQYHGHNTQYSFWLPALNIRTNYGHDWVEGNFEAGHTVWITVTNSTGEIKAFATGVTGPIDGWGGQSGFATHANVPWLGSQPDLQAGDWVYASMDNGLYAESHLGVINATVDVTADTVNGTISAPWYTDPLHVDCGIWEDGAPGIGGVDGVDPNGGSFTCDYAGTGWDILPGHMIGVSYNEPDGDQVYNIASNPAPRLHVWTYADGQPAAGSNFLLYIQYRNDSDAPAINTTISAVLEGGMTYLGDTSGLTPSGSGTPGDPLVWQLGTLQPDLYSDTRFDLFVQVTAAAGNWVTNIVQIDDFGDYDQDNPGDRDNQWRGEVIDNNTDLNIGKGAWTWNPVPGSQFVYDVNVCNNGSTDSSEVIVTDTLPLSTTLVSWWGREPGWEEVISSTHQLVVSRPTLQGNRCSEVYLRVELDANAWAGMELHNVAEVYASNDLDLDQNYPFTEMWHNVGSPHTNLSINKQWNWGVLAPGGEIRYNINYHNDGNIPASGVRITETLPASTTFRIAFWYDESGGHPFTPTLVTDQIVVWDIGALDNGYGGNFEVELKISPLARPGLKLVNTADITRLPGEDTYEDNTSSWTEMLNSHGPNLRVRKTGDWQPWGDGHYAWYNIVVENVGDMPAEHVTVTDTLPVSMMLDGLITDLSQVEGYFYNPAEGWFTMTFSYLHPNWRREIWMSLYNPTDPGLVVPGGQFFTNTVEIMPYEGEPTYADNTSQYTLASGPDLFVEKSLIAGDVLPGEEVTFRLVFGNQQVGHAGWWRLQGNAWLTDTLPAGTQFITATQHWCGWGEWCPVDPIIQGGTLAWQLWQLNPGEWNEIYLTVRLPDTLTGMDTVVNRATIASDQPDVDLEPDYYNNTSIFRADVLLPYFEVDKVYESSAVAGMPVVYTLTVSNIGNEAGTTVEVWDWIPDWVDYGGGGSYNAGLITWTMPLIGPDSNATAWFTGTLSCSSGGIVNNQYYFVNSSDQGINSTYGTPVSFSIQTPVIEIMAEASSTDVQIGETVYFTGTAATNGTALTYAWDFGGDGTAVGPNASHTFDTADSYTVTLTVTDGCEYTAEYNLTVEVTLLQVYLPLVRK